MGIIVLSNTNWETTLLTCNQWYDRAIAGLRFEDRADRVAAGVRFVKDLRATKESVSRENVGKRFEEINLLDKKELGQAMGAALGDIIACLAMPAHDKFQDAYDRMEQSQRNLRVAFALAAYRNDHMRFPQQLADLVPKYIPTIPGDLFSGKQSDLSRFGQGLLVV